MSRAARPKDWRGFPNGRLSNSPITRLGEINVARRFLIPPLFRLLGGAASLAAALAGCGQKADQPPRPSASLAIPSVVAALTDRPSPLIQKIFVYKMLGARFEYLETFTGPAMRIDSRGTRFYEVDGCDVRAGPYRGDVGYLRIEITPKCTFDSKPFLWNVPLGPLTQLTMGGFDKATGGLASANADCLTFCGRGEEFSLPPHETWSGAMADAQIEVLAEAGPEVDTNSWAKPLIAVHGEDWVNQGRFQCDERSSAIGKKIMEKVRVAAISIGFGVPSEDIDACLRATDPTFAKRAAEAAQAAAAAAASVEAASLEGRR